MFTKFSLTRSALVHYHSHLNIARELKDSVGEACALCNLGKFNFLFSTVRMR
jgi:hypothetical protein